MRACELAVAMIFLIGLTAPSPLRPASLQEAARAALENTHATGFVHIVEVTSGRLLTHLSAVADGDGSAPLTANTRVQPLSVIKVFVAAMWIERGFADRVLECAPSGGHPLRQMLVAEMLITGCDTAGANAAITLRRTLGASAVLDGLRAYGLHGLTLSADASDARWGAVLSLGEDDVLVTPLEVSAFFRAIGQDGGTLLSSRTARVLTGALDGVVARGTADGIHDSLAGTGWRLGGKTGTGPGTCGDHCDGWFASLLSDQRGARDVILVYIKGKGLGGGVAARTAATVAMSLIHER